MEHDFMADQIREILTQYVQLMGVINKVMADQIREMEKED